MNDPASQPSRPLPAADEARTLLWILQIFLATVFAFVGFLKTTVPLANLVPQMRWVADMPAWMVRWIGLAEMIGAVGLVVPAWTRIRPKLTTAAAFALAFVMLSASVFHVIRNDWPSVLVTGGLGALAMVVGLWRKGR